MESVKKPTICAIAAMAENRTIGAKGQLPWHLPADLAHFKAITSGHPIVMGRKTFESIGRPLPNRTNIIVTRDDSYSADGCVVVNSTEAALAEANKLNTDKVFIIGGAEIYKAMMPMIHTLYLTIVHANIEGDAHFPDLNGEWQEISREDHVKNEKNEFDYSFLEYQRA